MNHAWDSFSNSDSSPSKAIADKEDEGSANGEEDGGTGGGE